MKWLFWIPASIYALVMFWNMTFFERLVVLGIAYIIYLLNGKEKSS